MTTDVWIGGGDNEASNPNDWLSGLPAAGQDAMVFGPRVGGASSTYTMNVQGNELANDPILSSACALTVNATHALINSTVAYRGNVTFNLAQHSTLLLTADYMGAIVVNLSGADVLVVNGSDAGNPVINLAAGSEWVGTFSLDWARINAGVGATFDNDGASQVLNNCPGMANVVLPVAVIGKGGFGVAGGARLEFMRSVGAQQSVTSEGTIAIDDPARFLGSVTLQAGEIDLAGLANADGCSFQADMLRIYAGTQVVDTLRLTDQTPYGFEVEKTASGVGVVAYAGASRTPVGMPLAMHTV